MLVFSSERPNIISAGIVSMTVEMNRHMTDLLSLFVCKGGLVLSPVDHVDVSRKKD